MNKEKIFIVLGMHRSATSLIAGGLGKMNVNIGKRLLGANQSNIYGHFENLDFLQMNEKILKVAGGSWRDVPDEESILEAGMELKDEIKDVINRNRVVGGLWGWKDPRNVLTVKCYLPYIINPHYICIFRDPKDVAVSLYKRDGISIEDGIKLANEYNKRLINFMTNNEYISSYKETR